jgi:CRP/FNR family transcriptional regulator
MWSQKCQIVARQPLFDGTPQSVLQIIDGLAAVVEIERDRVLCRNGVTSREFFVLVSGRVAVLREGRLLAILRDGDWFGEISCLSADGMHTATVTALTDSVVLKFGDAEFRSMLALSPAAAARIRERAAVRLA